MSTLLPAFAGASRMYAHTWTDFDDDGFPDLFGIPTSGPMLLHNIDDGAGGRLFVEAAAASGFDLLGPAPMGISAADYDNDGDFDIGLSNGLIGVYYENVNGLMTRRPLAAALALAFAVPAAFAQSSPFADFTALPASVAAGSLPESAPFLLGNSRWTQTSIADRAAQAAAGQFNSGAWDMIDTNRTGADIGRYLFSPFETSQAGVQRTDRVTGQTVTMWASPAVAPAAVAS